MSDHVEITSIIEALEDTRAWLQRTSQRQDLDLRTLRRAIDALRTPAEERAPVPVHSLTVAREGLGKPCPGCGATSTCDVHAHTAHSRCLCCGNAWESESSPSRPLPDREAVARVAWSVVSPDLWESAPEGHREYYLKIAEAVLGMMAPTAKEDVSGFKPANGE